jgi:WD40 repeat protein/serine/threonine protein kinase
VNPVADWNPKANDLFVRAAEIDAPADRRIFLDQQCDGDAGLRAQVESLLSAGGDVGSFLERPAAPGLAAHAATAAYPPITEGPGTVIGPYRLMEQIGEGGFGLVFVAEQQEPVRRKVALKVIKPGMDSREVIARFEAERQALALMDHPNIARVLDAGATETGRPYFVMELVKGVPITDYCDRNQLTPRDRLELFVGVCQAVQHAHQKGVIHRDLKPSNVLVTLHDGRPVVKVIDFGIAKAVGQRLTDKTVYTRFAQLIGTPLYMSPEQAEMSGLDIDTRSDVYALGVLLYELLTGTTPFDGERLKRAAFDEVRRIIREEEPPRPSTRLSTLGATLSAVSARRRTEPGRLSALVRGELDWIVMRCLDKDRTRRYETANGLARDVERYLKDEPVEACPPTAGYRLRKFARKNRRLLATAAAFAALLLLGVAGSAWQAVRAKEAEGVAQGNAAQARDKEKEANEQRDDAQKQRDEVKAVNEKLEAALKELQATQAQLRRTLYTAHMNLAQRAWEDADLPRVRELLRQQLPGPGEQDLRSFEWDYCSRLCDSDRPLLTLTTSGVIGNSKVSFSPDGKHLIALSGVNGMTVWDAQTGQELPTGKLKGRMVLSPDGKRLAGVPDRATVKVWDAQTGQQLQSLPAGGNSSFSGFPGVIFSPDSKRLAVARGNEVMVWDALSGQEIASVKVGDVVYPYTDLHVSFNPDGTLLAGSRNKYEKDRFVSGDGIVWDVQTGKELHALKGHTDRMLVDFSPDGKRLVSSSMDGTVKVWDAKTGGELFSLKGQDFYVYFSPDSKRLVTTASENEATGRISVWDAQTGQVIFSLQRHTDRVRNLAFSADSKRLASSSDDRTLRIWDLQTGQEIRTLRGQIGWIVFSPDGKRLVSSSGAPDRIGTIVLKVWDVQKDEKDPRTFTLKGVSNPGLPTTLSATMAVFSSDLTRLAGATDKTVKVWDVRTGKEILTVKGEHTNAVTCVAFGPDGKCLASSDWYAGPGRTPVPGEVKVWDARDGRELHTLPVHASQLAFGPVGSNSLATAGDNAIEVWDTQTGKKRFPITAQTSWSGLAFSPDGKCLAGSDIVRDAQTGQVTVSGMVWDAKTGQELLTLPRPSSNGVVFSPDGTRLVTTTTAQPRGIPAGAGPQNTQALLTMWDAKTGRSLLTIPDGEGSYRFWSVAFSPDGKRLAAHHERQVKLWDVETGQEMLSLKAIWGNSVLAFSADGHRLGVVTDKGQVTIWDATPLPEKP